MVRHGWLEKNDKDPRQWPELETAPVAAEKRPVQFEENEEDKKRQRRRKASSSSQTTNEFMWSEKNDNYPRQPLNLEKASLTEERRPLKLKEKDVEHKRQKRPISSSQTSDQWSLPSNEFPFLLSQYNPLTEPAGPLGLRLKKSPSLLELVQSTLSQCNSDKGALPSENFNMRNKRDVGEEDRPSDPIDKSRASNFPASLLRIGQWEVFIGLGLAPIYILTMYGHAFFKRKIVWEVLDGDLKKKMEIQWADIVALKADCPRRGPSTLTIMITKQPLFFREVNLRPRRHSPWEKSLDFTGGEASTNSRFCRQHHLKFAQGVLRKHFEKLIQCDARLKSLSQQHGNVLDLPYSAAEPSITDHDLVVNKGLNQPEASKGFPVSSILNIAMPSTSQHSSSKTMELGARGSVHQHRSKEPQSASSVAPTHAIEGPSRIQPTMSMPELVDKNGLRDLKQNSFGNQAFSMNMSDQVNPRDMLETAQELTAPTPQPTMTLPILLERITQRLLRQNSSGSLPLSGNTSRDQDNKSQVLEKTEKLKEPRLQPTMSSLQLVDQIRHSVSKQNSSGNLPFPGNMSAQQDPRHMLDHTQRLKAPMLQPTLSMPGPLDSIGVRISEQESFSNRPFHGHTSAQQDPRHMLDHTQRFKAPMLQPTLSMPGPLDSVGVRISEQETFNNLPSFLKMSGQDNPGLVLENTDQLKTPGLHPTMSMSTPVEKNVHRISEQESLANTPSFVKMSAHGCPKGTSENISQVFLENMEKFNAPGCQPDLAVNIQHPSSAQESSVMPTCAMKNTTHCQAARHQPTISTPDPVDHIGHNVSNSFGNLPSFRSMPRQNNPYGVERVQPTTSSPKLLHHYTHCLSEQNSASNPPFTGNMSGQNNPRERLGTTEQLKASGLQPTISTLDHIDSIGRPSSVQESSSNLPFFQKNSGQDNLKHTSENKTQFKAPGPRPTIPLLDLVKNNGHSIQGQESSSTHPFFPEMPCQNKPRDMSEHTESRFQPTKPMPDPVDNIRHWISEQESSSNLPCFGQMSGQGSLNNTWVNISQAELENIRKLNTPGPQPNLVDNIQHRSQAPQSFANTPFFGNISGQGSSRDMLENISQNINQFEVPSLQQPLSKPDLLDHNAYRMVQQESSSNPMLSENVSRHDNQIDMLANLSQVLLSDTQPTTALAETTTPVSNVNSSYRPIQDFSSTPIPNPSDGQHDGNDGSNPDGNPMPENDNNAENFFADIWNDLSPIGSFPELLSNMYEDGEVRISENEMTQSARAPMEDQANVSGFVQASGMPTFEDPFTDLLD